MNGGCIMYKEAIFLKPVFQERIWGGQKLHTQFGYAVPYEQTGEAWVISAHPNGPSEILNGPLQGETLADAWEQHRELFNRPAEDEEAYPLLVKLLDAAKDLSVQVHPDDQYAREVEGQPYGKTECWYVVDAEEGAEIIFGHHAETREELVDRIENGDWDQLLRKVKVKTGDFIYVPSGTIHAIGAGIVILETQQSSDITYRVYDYDRKDAAGKARELHLDSSIKVTNVPHETTNLEEETVKENRMVSRQLVKEKNFTVYHWDLAGEASPKLNAPFLQVSVLSGQAILKTGDNQQQIKKGDHFILPATVKDYTIDGEAILIVSHPS